MSVRTEKVASVIKDELGSIIEKHLRFEIKAFLTVTSVEMTADLKIAKVNISIFNQEGDKDSIINRLNFHKKQIKGILAKHVHLKFLPDLHFYNDETLDKVEKLEKIFQQIHQNDAKK